MLTLWNPNRLDPAAMFDDFRRTFDHFFEPATAERPAAYAGPRINVYETADAFRLVADVPGLSADDVDISVQDDLLTIRGARELKAPEGYQLVRRERGDFRFERRFTLPSKVDGSQTEASLKDGVLTVVLPKRAESKPRQISVKAG